MDELYFVYLIGQACGPHRTGYQVQGPMSSAEGSVLIAKSKDKGEWYPVAYKAYPRTTVEDGLHLEKAPPTRAQFYQRARNYITNDGADCGGCIRGQDDLRELEAWAAETHADQEPSTTDKVEPFWWERMDGDGVARSYVDPEVTWKAVVASCKGGGSGNV